jgi:hypothetical protein
MNTVLYDRYTIACLENSQELEESMRKAILMVWAVVVLGFGVNLFAQEGEVDLRPGKASKGTSLLFREDFPSEGSRHAPLTQERIGSPNLELKMYGPGGESGDGETYGIRLSYEEDHIYPGKFASMVYSGVVKGSWALTLKDKNNYFDLRDTARIRWRVRGRGLHLLRPVVKLADGTMWVADYLEPFSTYFHENEVFLVDIFRWRKVNPETMAEARAQANEPLWRADLDLGMVDEIGFTDLRTGGGDGTQGNTSVDWIEVYGTPVARVGSQSQR